MELDNWFPTTVGRSYHPEWVDSISLLIDDIFDAPDKSVNNSFYYNGETTHGIKNLKDDQNFLPFTNFVMDQAKEFLNKQGYDSSRVPWRPYFFANSFMQGSNHPKHLHTQCSISGIFYVKVPPGSSDIVFHANRPFKDFFDYMFSIKDPNNWYSMEHIKYQPSPGLLLLWPAWLYHEVPPNNSTSPRTSIVFNL